MALITSLLVDGVEVAATRLRDQSITYDNQINGRSVLECVLVDKTISPVAPYIPTVRDTVLLEIDNTAVFGGILWAERVGNIAGPGRGVQTQATFTDYKALLDRVYFNGPIAAGSLYTQLVPLITNMLPHGITLSGLQESGPTMAAQGFNFLTIRQCLDALSAQTILAGGTTWIYTISPTGEFLMTEAGTQVAPFNLSEAVGNYRSASWSVDLNSYTNEIWNRYGPTGLALISQTFTGDNSTRTYALSQALVLSTTGVTPAGYVTVTRAGPSVSNENIDAEPVTGPAQWHYDAATNTLIQDDGGTVLNTGETVLVSYYVIGPFAAFERDDTEYDEFGPFTDVISMPEVTDPTIAQVTLSAELARRLGLQKKLTVLTDQVGAEPFQTITCTMPSLEVSGDYLITEVSLVEVTVNHNGGSGEREFAFELQCLEGNRYRGNWELFWRPEPRSQSSTGLYTPFTPPVGGCSAAFGIILHSDTWGGATPYTNWPDNDEGAGVAASADDLELGGGGVRLVGTGFLAANRLGKDFGVQFFEGCVEFNYQSASGLSTSSTSELVDIGSPQSSNIYLGPFITISHIHNGSQDEALRITYETNFGTITAYTSANGFISTSVLDLYRVEFKLSYAGIGYLRLYKNDALEFDSGLVLTWPGSLAVNGGFRAVRVAPKGTMANFVLRVLEATTLSSASPSVSPSVSPSASLSPSPGNSASVSPSSSVSPTQSPSVSPSSSVSPTASPSASISPSSSASRSVSPSVSPSSSSSRSQSPSASVSPSSSVSPSAGAGFPAQVGRTIGIVNSTPGTSHPITLPSGVQVGNLLLVVFSCNGAPTLSIGSGSGWNVIGPTPQSTNITAAIYWKIADGTDALTLTTSTSQDSVHRTHRFTGTSNTATTVTGTSTLLVASANGNPSAHTPPGGTDDYLWVVTYHGDGATASAAPTNYTDLVTASISGSRGTCYAERELNASSEDPGAWTCVLTNGVMYVLAIEPT